MDNFATTQWTLVWKAACEDSRHGRPALAALVQRYWQPLYAYARRRGMSGPDAEDATQEFLSQIISGGLLGNADPAKGRFRSFLLTAWKHFLVDAYRRDHAAKRGGEARRFPLDVSAGEQQWIEIQSREADPDRTFMRIWAGNLIDEVRQRLEEDYQSRDRSALFEALMPKLTQPVDGKEYEALAAELALSASAVKVALHRLRQRFGSTLREVVAETVDDPSEIDSELGELLEVLKSSRNGLHG